MSGESCTRVGLVGFGYWGPKLVRNFVEAPDVVLDCVVDRDADRLARVEAQYPGVRTTTNYKEMLQSRVDAVVVATPIRTHFLLAKAALLAGKHVLVEKPLAANSAEAEELVSISDTLGLTLMVGHTFEYNSAVRTLRWLIESGELGEIYYVDAARLNLGLFQPDINVLWDLAPHDFSILLYLLQNAPNTISARGSAHVRPGVHDVAYVEVRFPNNILGHVHLSWLDPAKVRRVTIVGSKKMVVFNDLSEAEKLRVYDKGVELHKDSADRTYGIDQSSIPYLQYRYGDINIPFIAAEEPLRNQCEHFVHCVQTGSQPQSDGRSGLSVVKMLEKADKSLQNGGALEALDLSQLVGSTAARNGRPVFELGTNGIWEVPDL